MKKALAIVIPALLLLPAAAALSAEKKSGEELFKEKCEVCHKSGGNVLNPKKTLFKKDREAHNIKTAADIIKTMRSPGPGMLTFDRATVSDEDAKKIADYILKTFK
jgi:cytochrome c6